MSSTFFRCLVLGSVFLAIASTVVDCIFPTLISQTLSMAFENEPVPRFLEDHPFISLTILLPWLVAVLLSTIGLLFFKRWARAIALYSTVCGFALYPFFGPTLSSAWASMLNEVSFMLWGAALALSYYSPLNARFSETGLIYER